MTWSKVIDVANLWLTLYNCQSGPASTKEVLVAVAEEVPARSSQTVGHALRRHI